MFLLVSFRLVGAHPWAGLFKDRLRKPGVGAKFELRFESLKIKFSLIFSVSKLMIGCSYREKYLRKCFRTKEKETRVKFNPGLSGNRPSNNWWVPE